MRRLLRALLSPDHISFMNCEYRNPSEAQISRSTMHQTLSSVHPATWLKFASYALLLMGVYFSDLTQLIKNDWAKDDYTYAYVIPFVVLYLIWNKRFDLIQLSSIPSWSGLAPLSLGFTLFWLGELGGNTFILYISLWFVLVGLLWLHLGWQKMKKISFALIVILSMFPLPSYLYNKLSVRLQLISTQLSALMIRFSGLPAFREGNIIDLGFTQLQVVEACSGLRYLFPLIVMGLLLAYFFQAALWKRAILIISTVPLAIVANSIRIALTGILHKIWGARVAEVFFHGFSAGLFLCCVWESSCLRYGCLAECRIQTQRIRRMKKSRWIFFLTRVLSGSRPAGQETSQASRICNERNPRKWKRN